MSWPQQNVPSASGGSRNDWKADFSGSSGDENTQFQLQNDDERVLATASTTGIPSSSRMNIQEPTQRGMSRGGGSRGRYAAPSGQDPGSDAPTRPHNPDRDRLLDSAGHGIEDSDDDDDEVAINLGEGRNGDVVTGGLAPSANPSPLGPPMPYYQSPLITRLRHFCTPIVALTMLVVFILVVVVTGTVVHSKSKAKTAGPSDPKAGGADGGMPIGASPFGPILQAAPDPSKYDVYSGLFMVLAGSSPEVDGSMYFVVPDTMLGKPFIITMIYTRGDAKQALLHMPVSEGRKNWFGFRLPQARDAPSEMTSDVIVPKPEPPEKNGTESRDADMPPAPFPTHIELFQPNYGTRISSDSSEMKTAYEEGAVNGTVGIFSVVKIPGIDGYAFDASLWVSKGFYLVDGLAPLFPRLAEIQCFKRNVNLEFDVSIGGMVDTVDVAARIQFSLVALPDALMKTRHADERIGFFTTSFYSLDTPEVKHSRQDLINRWNLERLSKEPPIPGDKSHLLVYYVDPTVPERFRRAVKAGVEAWNSALGYAEWSGVMRAVLPTDSDWPHDYHPGDVRYSSISWAPSLGSTFALGPSDVDPRTGEILEADIVFTHSWISVWFAEFETFLADDDWQFDVEDSERQFLLTNLSDSGFNMYKVAAEYGLNGNHQNAEYNLSRYKGPGMPKSSRTKKKSTMHFPSFDLEELSKKTSHQLFSEWYSMSSEQKDQSNPYRRTSPIGRYRRFIGQEEVDPISVSMLGVMSRHSAYEELSRELRLESENGNLSLEPAFRIPRLVWKNRAARKFDEFLQDALVSVVMHEVGHTLGLRHNFRASANTPWAKLDNQSWVNDNSICTSVMDYIPINIRADPTKQTHYFMKRVGRYDTIAMAFGYWEASRKEIDILAAQAVQFGLHFMTDEDDPSPGGLDPYVNVYDLSDSPVSHVKEQILVADAVFPKLYNRAMKQGETFSDFTTDFLAVYQSVFRAASNVVKFIGGQVQTRERFKSLNPPVRAVDLNAEKEALDFIVENLDPENGFFGLRYIRNYTSILVSVSGYNCGDGMSDCSGVLGVNFMSTIRGWRLQYLLSLLTEFRIENMHKNVVMRSVVSQGGDETPSLTPVDVLQRIGDVFFGSLWKSDGSESSQLEATAKRQAQGDWVDLLKHLWWMDGQRPGSMKFAILAELSRLKMLAQYKLSNLSKVCADSDLSISPLSGACVTRLEVAALIAKMDDQTQPPMFR